MSDVLTIVIEPGDILESQADVALLKHAQSFYTADGAVMRALEKVGVPRTEVSAPNGQHRLVSTRGALAANEALFLGCVRLSQLGYHEMRQFMTRALVVLQAERPAVRRIATTVHGANYGLDEDETVLSLVGSLIDGWQAGLGPKDLEQVTIVELNLRRAQRLRKAIERGLAGGRGVSVLPGEKWGFTVTRSKSFAAPEAMRSAGTVASVDKPHAFVAMPFTAEMEDVYHFGIQGPVRAAGLLCERVDQAVFDGLIIERIRQRIDTAKVVIADLTGANPNVYLEVGYAWGRGRQTILLTRSVDELRFDVQGHRCIVYGSIRELEKRLIAELEHLK